jgi:hypothetical protein
MWELVECAVLQFLSRGISFVVGLFITSETFQAAPGVLGVREYCSREISSELRTASARKRQVANVQFQLLLSLILYLTREGVRRACAELPPAPGTGHGAVDKAYAERLAGAVNLTWLLVLVGALTASAFSYVFLRFSVHEQVPCASAACA